MSKFTTFVPKWARGANGGWAEDRLRLEANGLPDESPAGTAILYDHCNGDPPVWCQPNGETCDCVSELHSEGLWMSAHTRLILDLMLSGF